MTRRIPFSDITAVFICPAHNEKYLARKTHMEALCTELGFKEVVHWKSGTEAYPECLNNATISILEHFANQPILLLEDDVDFQGIREFDVPDDADAVYLGLSKCAGSKIINQWQGNSQFVPYSHTQVRVQNMLSGHAIYYHSAIYRRVVAEYLRSYGGTKYYNDVLISRLQPCFRIYANKKPLFYQANRFNVPHDLEAVTRFEIP
jgi:hypothetical protein